jgi:hypothetical protein
MTNTIHLGFEVGAGRAVEIPLRHMAVTGQTQESGKTTTLEGLISRSGLRAVAYVTKRGESSFHVANPIPPYFQERADWKFVLSLLEASTETKLKFEQSWIMRASEGARTLLDVRANIGKFLHGVRDTTPLPPRKKGKRDTAERDRKERWIQKPARGLSGDVYYVLDKYLDDVMPQLAEMPYSTKLELAPGVNVMDLRDYEFPLQALVVRSVIDWTRDHEENTINVIPEAWKFAPKQKGSPVRQSAEELIREGGALKNFLWIDSQDLAGVADVLMRQVGVWIFGVQRAKHEIVRALDHMPEGLPSRRPRPQDIATLSKGQFYVCFGREMYKVYVQPAWMTAAHAEAIARGEEDVDSARDILKDFDRAQPKKISRPAAAGTDGRSSSQTPAGKRANAVGLETRGITIDGQIVREKGEDPMWKEKYDELKAQYDQLVEAHDATAAEVKRLLVLLDKAGLTDETPRARRAAGNGTMCVPSLNDIYIYVKERAAKEGPVTLLALAESPELIVKRERRRIEQDASTLRGALAILIAEKFFDGAREFTDIRKELIRRGMLGSKAPNQQISQSLQGIVELGFLTKEDAGYQAVAGMKVNIVEA